jgi:carbon storage regulator
MLVLTRKKDQSIVIGDGIEIVVTQIDGNTVKLGINADKSVKIFRKEVLDEIKASNETSIADINVFKQLKKTSK